MYLLDHLLGPNCDCDSSFQLGNIQKISDSKWKFWALIHYLLLSKIFQLLQKKCINFLCLNQLLSSLLV